MAKVTAHWLVTGLPLLLISPMLASMLGLSAEVFPVLLLSILIHVALFLLAGMLVVFTVVKKEEPVFEPPKSVERPKMKLKKPKVKVKKSSKPKSTHSYHSIHQS